jgi:general secretion pathway protein A
MYAEHFRLRKAPFSIAPDPRFLYMSAQHREALAHLLYGVGGGGGFVLLTGEIGAGKTTLCRCFLEQVPADCQVAYVFNPKLTVPELLQTICEEFHVEVPAAAGTSVKAYVDAINAFLLQVHAGGRSAVLIIDEAQSLAPELLEQLRLLTNLETHERKLLQIILIGQPELREMLAQPGLEQLAQRVIARYHLEALSENETRAYVKHRLAVAGGERLPFDRQAMARLFALSGGVPRRINLLADRALLGAYAQGRHQVDRLMLEQAAREVFGAPGQAARRWPWLLGGGAAAAAAAFAGWSLWPMSPMSPRPMAAATPARAASAPLATANAASAPPAAAGAASAATAVAAARSHDAAAPDDLVRALAVGHRDEAAALRELARSWQVDLGAGDACAAVLREGLACLRSRAGLYAVRQFARPVVLGLRGSEGGIAFVRLIALGDDQAVLESAGQRFRVTLPALAGAWRGDFVTLWRPPPGWPPGGATPPDTLDSWLAAQLASAGQGDAARPLPERIRAFQLSVGLQPDGVPGPATLMRLARASGAGEPRLAAAAPDR